VSGSPGVTRPAPESVAFVALLEVEVRLAARRPENLLVTIIVPAAVLAFFASTAALPIPGPAVDTVLPGTIALAVIAASLVSLGIATGYERAYGVLKRLGGAPVRRSTVLAARLGAVALIECVTIAALVSLAAVAFGWRPGTEASPLAGLAGLVLGTIAFGGIGLALAGSLRPETTLAAANGAFVGLLLVGGIVLPVDHLGEPLRTIAALLPSAPLVELLGIGLGSGPATGSDPTGPLVLLAAWAGASAGLAVRVFRWE